ncbi:PREDICTED: serine/arginine repetitive matrix protein 3-like [Chinchilla lanigera]|uniref:serine/arginine repetitive matrix protein 3-like n=1 Tax=Chinchilla lanigera TaxID=34839 RepID=UPI0006986C70|nr:PREDICTED: serine/arginine repetitive matrix protein 3-like [Chinchilla lanigera]
MVRPTAAPAGDGILGRPGPPPQPRPNRRDSGRAAAGLWANTSLNNASTPVSSSRAAPGAHPPPRVAMTTRRPPPASPQCLASAKTPAPPRQVRRARLYRAQGEARGPGHPAGPGFVVGAQTPRPSLTLNGLLRSGSANGLLSKSDIAPALGVTPTQSRESETRRGRRPPARSRRRRRRAAPSPLGPRPAPPRRRALRMLRRSRSAASHPPRRIQRAWLRLRPRWPRAGRVGDVHGRSRAERLAGGGPAGRGPGSGIEQGHRAEPAPGRPGRRHSGQGAPPSPAEEPGTYLAGELCTRLRLLPGVRTPEPARGPATQPLLPSSAHPRGEVRRGEGGRAPRSGASETKAKTLSGPAHEDHSH